jgi:NADPH:quinone reductase
MTTETPDMNVTMLSLVKADGELELSLARQRMPQPGAHEVLVKVLAAPISPSDLFLMLAGAQIQAAKAFRRDGLPVISAPLSGASMRGLAGRVGQAMPVGNEGSGIVVKAGASAEAQALLGKRVALLGRGTFAQYCLVPAGTCMVLPEGTDARDGASGFVNPMTALGFVETMRRDGHKAIIHTAAASNVGQMLNRLCISDGIPLVNIVRKSAQVEMLKAQGAQHVVDSTSPTFMDDLTTAIVETGATVVFDAIGGGTLGAQILGAIEQVAVQRMAEYDRYGSNVFKQLYIYGALDYSPTVFTRSHLGFKWSISGWLLPHFLAGVDAGAAKRMRARVAAELATTFATAYGHEISLEQALDLETIIAYNAKQTGEKCLIIP